MKSVEPPFEICDEATEATCFYLYVVKELQNKRKRRSSSGNIGVKVLTIERGSMGSARPRDSADMQDEAAICGCGDGKRAL